MSVLFDIFFKFFLTLTSSTRPENETELTFGVYGCAIHGVLLNEGKEGREREKSKKKDKKQLFNFIR